MSPTKEMGGSQDDTTKNPETMAAPAYIDIQSPSTFPPVPVSQRSQKEVSLKKVQLVLRSICFVFSFVSFVIMASNRNGLTTNGNVYFSNNYNDFEEYRYLLAIGIISTVYTKAQVVHQIIEFRYGKCLLSQRVLDYLDFIGDQIMAYLLLSSASAAVPQTTDGRNLGVLDSSFTSSSAASISMALLAFVALALSAIVSGYKLSTRTYI